MSSSGRLRARGWSCITEDSQGSSGEPAGGEESLMDRGAATINGGEHSTDTVDALGGNERSSSSSAGQFADADDEEEECRRGRKERRLPRAPVAGSTAPVVSTPPRSSNHRDFPVFTPPSSFKRRRSDGGETDEESDEDLFHVDESRSASKGDPADRSGNDVSQRRDDPLGQNPRNEESDRGGRAEALAVARSRLSQWASRLSDPDRPRLVEPPKSIPLNDEFLLAFGRRVQMDNSELGKFPEAIDASIGDDENDFNKNEDGPADLDEFLGPTEELPAEPEATPKSAVSERKVKILNLRYTTTEATLLQACQRMGEVEEINLIMDGDNDRLNKGRAYVTFANVAGAKACLEQLTVLDGRTLRLAMANENPPGGGGKAGGGGFSATQARYWLQDLATKCFRCGQVGHMEKDCPNEAPPKPCPLCAMTTHDMRECPFKATCFNCGLSGHIGRDCPTPRGRAVQRVVCTICLQSGHHRLQCRQGDAVQHLHRANARLATCMVCHQLGHYCCKDSKWFYGLDTLTCSNCGRVGHAGFQCDRPRLEVCSRPDNAHIVMQEVDRAAIWTTAEEHFSERQLLSKRRQERSPNGIDRGRSDPRRGGSYTNFQVEEARRAKSLPPQRYNNGTNVGRNEYHQVESTYWGERHESDRRDSYNRGASQRNTDSSEYRSNGMEQGPTTNDQWNEGGGNNNGNAGYRMSSLPGSNNQKRSRWR